MIQLYHVKKKYQGDEYTLKDVNLQIDKGEFVCLMGSSGAGKTTLLRLIFCEEKPTEGQIIVDGRNVSRIARDEISNLRRSVGVVFQNFKLIHHQSVFENVALPLRLLGLGRAQVKQRVSNLLRLVGLWDKENSMPMQLSGGEQQRVTIARALITDPKILLADEPTGNLDADLSNDIMDLLREINIRGTTVLMVSHDYHAVARVGQRIITLKEGMVEEG